MAERAGRWIEDLLPRVAVRQVVFTVPWSRRWLLARDADLLREVVDTMRSEVTRWLRRHGVRGLDGREGEPGSISVIQRFGSTLNLNVHVRMLLMAASSWRTSAARRSGAGRGGGVRRTSTGWWSGLRPRSRGCWAPRRCSRSSLPGPRGRWWVPKAAPITLLVCELDVRVGGRYRLVFGVDGSDQKMEFFGRYLEVVPPTRLVWTNDEGDEGGALTTVTFEEAGGRTLVVVHDRYPSKEALEEAIASGSTEGMPEQLEQLAALVSALGDPPSKRQSAD
jgi:uncharacterized protein YndB with AHSA1/START domain